MKRDLAAILGLLKRRPRCGGGDATKSPGGPDAAGAKRTKRPRAARLPLGKDSSGVGRRLRSRPLCSPLDRSVQTDAQAKPAPPDDGTASGASALEAFLDLGGTRV